MSRRGWRPYVDLVEVDTIEVVLEEDEPVDEFLALLHEIALEAIALRAHSPGDPRVEVYDEEAPAPPDGHATARLVRRIGKRRLVLAAAVAVVALAAAIAPGIVEARRAAARLAALEASPGVLTAASSPPAELWRTPGRVVDDQADVLLVAGTQDGSLRRVDPATGGVLWTVGAGDASPIGRCFPVDGALGPDRAPGADGAAGPATVACVPAADPNPSEAEAPLSRVVLLDPSTGTVTRTVAVQGSLLAAEPLDGDLLVVARLADGRLSAARWDLGAQAPRWEYTSPQPVVTEASDALELRSESLTVGGIALDLATGEERDAEDARRQPIRFEEYTLPGGERATWWWYAEGAYGQGRVTSDHAMRVFALLGPPLVPALTDGSLASTLVTTGDGDRLRGLDLRNGRIRWSRDHPGVASVRATLQVDGVMILEDGTTATAIDVGDGSELWRAPVDPDVTGSALTDGEVLLLPERDRDGGVELVARRIADGATLWRAAMPAGTVSLTVVGQQLVAWTGDEVVGLG